MSSSHIKEHNEPLFSFEKKLFEGRKNDYSKLCTVRLQFAFIHIQAKTGKLNITLLTIVFSV